MRRFNQFYAWITGRFWIPCPICGRMFGGHEIGDIRIDLEKQTRLVGCRMHNDDPERLPVK